jgi:hypothetical protein
LRKQGLQLCVPACAHTRAGCEKPFSLGKETQSM